MGRRFGGAIESKPAGGVMANGTNLLRGGREGILWRAAAAEESPAGGWGVIGSLWCSSRVGSKAVAARQMAEKAGRSVAGGGAGRKKCRGRWGHAKERLGCAAMAAETSVGGGAHATKKKEKEESAPEPWCRPRRKAYDGATWSRKESVLRGKEVDPRKRKNGRACSPRSSLLLSDQVPQAARFERRTLPCEIRRGGRVYVGISRGGHLLQVKLRT